MDSATALARYTVVLAPDGPVFMAMAPAIPGCYAVGNSPEEAHRELGFVFEMIAEEFAERGEELPPDVGRDWALAG